MLVTEKNWALQFLSLNIINHYVYTGFKTHLGVFYSHSLEQMRSMCFEKACKKNKINLANLDIEKILF